MSDLTLITKRLADFDVRFVVAGGLATILQGSALMTRVVDVACDMSPDNLARVWQALAELNPCHRMTPERLPFTSQEAAQAGWNNLYLTTDIGQLDLLGQIMGVGDYAACLERSEPLQIAGTEVRVLTLDALIAAKRALGRPRDLHALLELEVIRENRNRPNPS